MTSAERFHSRAPKISPAARGLPRDPRNTGPATVSRFNFQAKCVALTIVEHMLTGELAGLIIEHSTDIVLDAVDGPPTLVSVKHREASQASAPGWTWSALNKQKVLQALHAAWLEAEKQCLVAFWSNSGLTGDAYSLVEAVHASGERQRENALRDVLPALAKHLKITLPEAREFLEHLRLQPANQLLPHRNTIDDVGVRAMARLLVALGRNQTHAEACWQWLLTAHVEPASTDPAESSAYRSATAGSALRAVAARLPELELNFRYLPIGDMCIGLLREADRRDADETPLRPALVPDPLFVGRTEQLDRLEGLLCPGGVDPVSPVVLYGMPGCGKTSLALQFAAEHSERLRILVIDASTRAGVVAGLEAMAPGAAPEGRAEGLAALRTPTTNALAAGSAVLLVFDGVTDPDVLRGLVPRTNLCRVLITSTVAHLDDAFQHIELDVWSREETLDYIRRAGLASATDECASLAEELFDHPLAVCQAVNYCRTVGIGIGEYLARLRSAPTSVLDRGMAAGHPDSIVSTVRLAEAALASTDPALALLMLLAHLGPAPVHLSVLDREGSRAMLEFATPTRRRRAFKRQQWQPDPAPAIDATIDQRESLRSPLIRDEAVARLRALSLISGGGESVSVHPLVQSILRATAPGWHHWLELALGLFLDDVAGAKSAWWVLDAHLSHLAACISHARERDLISPALTFATCAVITRQSELGDHDAAVATGYQLLKAFGTCSGKEHGLLESVFEAHSAMLRPLVLAGRSDEALALAEHNVAQARAAGLDGLEWRAYVDLAEIGYATGSRELAVRILDSLPGTRQARSERTVSLRLALANTRAKLLYVLNRFEEAAGELGWALDVVAGLPEDPSTSTFAAVLNATAAELHECWGDPAASLARARLSLQAQRERHANCEPDRGYLATLLSAADAAIDLKDLPAAKGYLDEAEQLAVAAFGPGTAAHASLLGIRGRYRLLAAITGMEGGQQFAIAPVIEDLEAAAAGLRSRNIMRQLPSVLVHLAQAYVLETHYDAARDTAAEALAIDARMYPPDHPQIAVDKDLVAQIELIAALRPAT